MTEGKPRILVLTTIFPNNTDVNRGIYVLKQTRELSSLCSVDVVAPVVFYDRFRAWRKREKPVNKTEYIDELVVRHPPYFSIPGIFRNLNGIFMFLSLYRYHKKMHREKRWEAIISHFAYPDGFFAILTGMSLGIPVFITCLGSDINKLGQKTSTKMLVRWGLQKSARVFAVSESLKRRIVALGIDEKKVEVIINGVEANRFSMMDQDAARRSFGLPVDAKILLYVGRLSDEKGVDILIRAVSVLKNRNFKLVIAGGGPQGNSLKELSLQLGMTDVVSFLGPLPNDEIPRLMNAADLFVLPSRSEGYPNVLLEALACGVPPLATGVGGVPEILSNEELGMIVPPEDPSCMAKAIEAALEREWDRKCLVDHVLSQSWEANAEKTFAAIKDFMTGNDSILREHLPC